MTRTCPFKKQESYGILYRILTNPNKPWRDSITRDIVHPLGKLNDFVDDNFKSDENGGKLSYKLENTVGKGEIARKEQFLLFPQCFQKTCTADT